MCAAPVAEDTFFVDRTKPFSLQAQIRESIVSAITSRRMVPGAQLPSSRRLAAYLGVSRITVISAYECLVSQGYLTTSNRRAYLVAEDAPAPRLTLASSTTSPGDGVDWRAKLTRGLGGFRRIEKPPDWRRYPFPFIYGQMDRSLFDHGAWRECARQALGLRDFDEMAGDMAAADDPMLVDYICKRSLPRRGIRAQPDEILVTLGAQNAIWLVVQLMMREGFHAACENPGYPDVINTLRWSGARVTPIDVDRDGLPPDALPQDLDAVIVTPSHQAPTAVTMSVERRHRLLEAAGERDFVVVEDDYDFEMSFLKPPSPALKSLDQLGRVLYVGSFSKALFPGLRLGYLVAPGHFIVEARRLRSLMLRHPPGHLQRTTAYFLALGHYDHHVRSLRKAFAERYAVAVRALEREGLEICGRADFGGTNLWVGGPKGLDSACLAKELRQDGVLIEPGAPFFDDKIPVRYFRLAYSSIPVEKIDEGIRIIRSRISEVIRCS